MVTHTGKRTLRAQISEEIRVLLVRRQMTARQLAEAIGWSQSALSRKLSGQAGLSVEDLEKIAKVLDVLPTDLMPDFITRREWSSPRLAAA